MSLRILHTSDWHLGQISRGESREPEHREFLKWLAGTIKEQAVDVLLVSGDVFHTRTPSAEALALYFNFLELLRAEQTGVQVVITGGNHDSAAMLNAPSELLAALGVHVVGGYDRSGEDSLLVPVRPAHVRCPPTAVIAAVPYVHEWFVCGNADDGDALASGFRDLYTRVADAAESRFPDLPLVGMGHLTIAPPKDADNETDTSERESLQTMTPTEIHRVGYLGALPVSIFDDRYRYVALGHIHRSYFPEAGRVGYSGSPIALNFTEPWQSRCCLLTELDELGLVTVTRLPIPCWRRMITLKGKVDSVLDAAKNLSWDEELPPLVRITAEMDEHDPRVYEHLAAAFAHLDGHRPRILETTVTSAAVASAETNDILRLAQQRVTPDRVFRLAWHAANDGQEPPDSVAALFSEFLNERPEVLETEDTKEVQ